MIGRGAGQEILYRLMDAVDPAVVDTVEGVARNTPGVFAVHDVRVRWFGHRLIAELHADVTADLPTSASHEIGEQIRHALLHRVAGLSEVLVHIDPARSLRRTLSPDYLAPPAGVTAQLCELTLPR